MKRVFIRADSSESIGTGHIMRCLTLAKEMASESDVSVEFICQELLGNINFLIEEQGFIVNRLEPQESFDFARDAEQTSAILTAKQATLLVVDSYQVNEQWINLIRSRKDKLFVFVIDDLADRFLPADALLNQNFLPDIASKYQSLVPKDCCLFLGPKYTLLREEFYRTKDLVNEEREKSSIVVFFGGTDPTGETLKVLPVLEPLSKDFDIDIITGASNKHNAQIEKLVSPIKRINYHCQVSNISHYMARASFAIGAGGSTCLERMFFALPSITVVTAENQLEATEYYQSQGLVKNLGWHDSVSADDIYQACLEITNNPEILFTYQRNMQEIGVGSRGAACIANAVLM